MEGFVAGLAERGVESGRRAMIFRSWGEFRGGRRGGVQYVRYPAGLCAVLDCVRDPVVHSPVTSLSRRFFPPSFHLARPFARSLALAACCLSPSFFDVILPCYYLYHRSRSSVREVAEKRDRDERRSRKEVSRACGEASVLSLLYRSRWLFLRISYELFFMSCLYLFIFIFIILPLF